MKKRTGKVALVSLVMALALSGVAFAGVNDVTWANVPISPTIEQAFSDYGISMATLMKSSDQLTLGEKNALAAVFGDSDVRATITSLVNSEMWPYVTNDSTIAQIVLAGHVYRIGTPDAFDAFNN